MDTYDDVKEYFEQEFAKKSKKDTTSPEGKSKSFMEARAKGKDLILSNRLGKLDKRRSRGMSSSFKCCSRDELYQ